MKRPAFQFYPADWRKDSALQSCSVTARGLWIEMICIMHESENYGFLEINGKKMCEKVLARLVGESPTKLKKLLAELEAFGVFSRDNRGVIYSRRMLKDQAIREARADGGRAGAEHGIKGKEHGSKGGMPRKETGDIKPPLNPPPSSSSSSSSSSSDIPPNPQGGTESKPPKKSDNIPTTPQALRIASLYHRRPTTRWTDKEVKSYKKLGQIDPEDLEMVCRYTEAERAKGDDGRHRRDLLTFLNNFTGELDRAREKPINGHHVPKQIQFID